MFINDAVVCMRLALTITAGLLLGVYKTGVGGWWLCTLLQLRLYKMLSAMWVAGGCVQVYSCDCARC